MLLRADCTHIKYGISTGQINHTHPCVMCYSPLVYMYPWALPRDHCKLMSYTYRRRTQSWVWVYSSTVSKAFLSILIGMLHLTCALSRLLHITSNLPSRNMYRSRRSMRSNCGTISSTTQLQLTSSLWCSEERCRGCGLLPPAQRSYRWRPLGRPGKPREREQIIEFLWKLSFPLFIDYRCIMFAL